MNAPAPVSRFASSRFWRAFPAGMRRRWWLFRLLDLAARHWPVSGMRKGLVVVRMDGIGDMVLFRASLDHYAEVFGVARGDITVLGCKSWEAIAVEAFAGYRVLCIDEHAYARRPFHRFAVSLMVRRLNPAITVCDAFFRRALMADSLAWITGAPRTVMSLPYISNRTRAEFTWYLSQASEVVDTGPYPVHEIVRHFAFLSHLASDAIAPGPPELPWREAEAPVPAGGPYAVLNPGSNEPGRRWPIVSYVALAARLLDDGLRVVLVGSPAQRPPESELASIVGRAGFIDLMGKTSLPGLLDLLKHAALVVSNDSGPAHVAIALGAPTVVIVGGGHFGSFFPYPDGVAPANARFLHRVMDCYHCFWRCPKRASEQDSFPCVAAVPLDDAWAAARDLLAPVRQTLRDRRVEGA